MTNFKALVRNKDNKSIIVIESEYSRKKDFIRDIRQNGFAVSDHHVKEASEFDRIMNTTNCSPDDWKRSKA